MNDLIVAGRQVRISDGLYCLNDLHKASGGEDKHKPSNWLALQQTAELVEELQKEADAGIPASGNYPVIRKMKGGAARGGTFACRELVYAYATWISPRFFLTVLRTFDAAVSGRAAVPQGRPPLLPLRPPRDYAEACALADETLRESNALSCRLAKVEPWLRYWRDVFVEEARSLPKR